ncbi:unnamed protein product [Pedinophyceae sp. YPF-701]|nr:unnamed protein product [Pedinophyceae sp. YPF-701]
MSLAGHVQRCAGLPGARDGRGRTRAVARAQRGQGAKRDAPRAGRRATLFGITCGCPACARRARAGEGASENAGWYDGIYARMLDEGMEDYNATVEPLKRRLFGELWEAIGSQPHVVELGIGTAPNLKFYPPGARVTGVEPKIAAMRPYAERAASEAQVDLNVVPGVAEAIPLPDGCADAVVSTLVLCSVADQSRALAEIRRVLRPPVLDADGNTATSGGSLLLIEHVFASPARPLLRFQQRLFDPLQALLADGCHLTRDTAAAVRAAGAWSGGVELRELDVDGAGLIGPHVAGIATL